MAHTDAVRSNRELWFQTVPGAREAYQNDPVIRTTVDSVDAALSMADRAMREQGVSDDVRAVVLHYAVFKSDTCGIVEARERVFAFARLAAPQPLDHEQLVARLWELAQEPEG